MSTERERFGQRGGALLMVLWLSAALSAIAFSVALSVRGEISRADTSVEGLRAYYLACGAADRALNYMMYGAGPVSPGGIPRFWRNGMPLLRFAFPNGDAAVEIVPESSKISINSAPQPEIYKLLLVLGVAPEQAQQTALAIIDWRAGSPGQGVFQAMYLSRSPSFRAPHASFEQIEELMSVAGVTPDLFYGGFIRDPEGTLVPRPGLRDCLSVYSGGTPLEVNTANPAVMVAAGVPPQAVEQIVKMRSMMPIQQPQMGAIAAMAGPAAGRLRLGGDNIYTLRATARIRRPDGKLSDLRRTVAMTVQLNSRISPDGFRVLAWQDNAASRPLFDVWPN